MQKQLLSLNKQTCPSSTASDVHQGKPRKWLIQESLDVANREIKAGKAENTNIKAAKKQEAHHHKRLLKA